MESDRISSCPFDHWLSLHFRANALQNYLCRSITTSDNNHSLVVFFFFFFFVGGGGGGVRRVSFFRFWFLSACLDFVFSLPA